MKKAENPIFERTGEVVLGDMTLLFETADGVQTFTIVPKGMPEKIPPHRKSLDDAKPCRGLIASGAHFPAIRPESRIQAKFAGDAYPGEFSGGSTMRNSATNARFEFVSQMVGKRDITTYYQTASNVSAIQKIELGASGKYLIITTRLVNNGTRPVGLEYFASFSLGMLSPFQQEDGAGAYRIHRVRSHWSAEAALESRTAEDLNLEMSWQGYGSRGLRFGQNSSMPVKDYYPAVVLEDVQAGVSWGAELDAFGAWMLEVSRCGDFFNLSGGIPDREFGGWTRVLAPGDGITGPTAVVSCAKGGVQEILNRLQGWQSDSGQVPEEKSLPVIFNDWCTTWGHPTEANLLPIANVLEGSGVRYFVMDAGWYSRTKPCLDNVGGWEVCNDLYSGGFAAFCGKLRNMGFVPGIWFEFEAAAENCENPPPQDYLLKLDGVPLRSGIRQFLDFRKPDVIDYLVKKVICFLKDNQIGYLKVDYNAPIPIGCDGPQSSAENLRVHTTAVVSFFERIKRAVPGLVLEICSSGGHRMSPGWMRLASMGSFSDAHEGVEIPLIAAASALLVPMRSSQIWAVLYENDTPRRTAYSLAAGFLGRLCVSGEIASLSARQKRLLRSAVDFYGRVSGIILDGVSSYEPHCGPSRRYPTGWQVFRREGRRGMLLVVHTFGRISGDITMDVPSCWVLSDVFSDRPKLASLQNGELTISNPGDFSGFVIYLKKKVKHV